MKTPPPFRRRPFPPPWPGGTCWAAPRRARARPAPSPPPFSSGSAARPAPGRPIRALILTPTRELAIQIQESFEAYGKYLPLRSAVIFGGVGQKPQVEALKRGVDILIATPGRLMDLHEQGFVDLDKLEIFVLDEADRMLDMGFIHDVRKILKWLPRPKSRPCSSPPPCPRRSPSW